MIYAEPLCKKCNPEVITRLRYIRTVLNPEPVKIYYCPRCRGEFHEYQIIWSNFTWLYEEEAKLYEETPELPSKDPSWTKMNEFDRQIIRVERMKLGWGL